MDSCDYRRSHIAADAARYYETLYAPGTYDSWIWELERAYLAQAVRRHLLSRQANIRLLDFACGTGRVLAFLEPMTLEATGTDVSPAMLAIAERRLARAKLLCADITTEDILPSRGYDLVTAFRFFLNADDTLREQALKAIRRVLADDGILITNIHGNLLSLRFIAYLVRRYLLRQGINAVSFWKMKHVLARHGFDVIEVRCLGWSTPRLYQLLGRRCCDRIERIFTQVPVLRYLATNFIFVCKKSSGDQNQTTGCERVGPRNERQHAPNCTGRNLMATRVPLTKNVYMGQACQNAT